jgi:hypothetical protein
LTPFLKQIEDAAHANARMEFVDEDNPLPTEKSTGGKARAKAKPAPQAVAADDEEEDDDEHGASTKTRSAPPGTKPSGASAQRIAGARSASE